MGPERNASSVLCRSGASDVETTPADAFFTNSIPWGRAALMVDVEQIAIAHAVAGHCDTIDYWSDRLFGTI